MELRTVRQLSFLTLGIAFTASCAAWLHRSHDLHVGSQLGVLAAFSLPIIFACHMWRIATQELSQKRSTVMVLKQQCMEAQEKYEAFRKQLAALEEQEEVRLDQARRISLLEKENAELVYEHR